MADSYQISCFRTLPCITSDQDSTFDFLSSLFLSFVFIKLVRYADENCPGGALPVPVHVLGEELCACGVIPDLSRKISVIRSRNISMSCVFQNLAGLQNRYPLNQWQEILGNCDVTLFLGCTDALTADFISQRTGEASITVTSTGRPLGAWRISNYTPEYRETSGVGKRRLMTMDEVLRMDIDKALVILRGTNVLEVDTYDYSKHPESKKLRPGKASAHVPAWRAALEAKRGAAAKETAPDQESASRKAPVPAAPKEAKAKAAPKPPRQEKAPEKARPAQPARNKPPAKRAAETAASDKREKQRNTAPKEAAPVVPKEAKPAVAPEAPAQKILPHEEKAAPAQAARETAPAEESAAQPAPKTRVITVSKSSILSNPDNFKEE